MAEISVIGSATLMQRGPYISMITNRMVNLLIRATMLFMVGVFLALVLNLLQVQRNVTLFPPDVISSIFSSAWWVPPCCGTAAGKHQYVRCTNICSALKHGINKEKKNLGHSVPQINVVVSPNTLHSLWDLWCFIFLWATECYSSFSSIDRFAVSLYGQSPGGAP